MKPATNGPLPRDQQRELARQAASGDRRAAGLLVSTSRGFIVKMVRRLAGPYLRDDSALEADLIAEGERGMYEALLRYDATRPLHPLTYCAHWIALRVRNALTLSSGPASVGSPQHWREIGRPHTTAVDLETVVDDASPDAASAEELLLAHETAVERRSQLNDALSKLDPTDRRILVSRLLAEPESRQTLSDVGRAVGLSRERTRQREIEALKQLLEHLGVPADRLSSVRKLARGG